MRFTVTRKIAASIAIIALIGIIAMLFIYRGLNRVEREVQRLAHVEEPLILAAYEMEINMNGIGLAVLKYLSTGLPRYRDWAAKDLADFEGFHATYSRLIKTPEERAFNDKTTRLYAEFKSLAHSLMQRADEQQALFDEVAGKIERIDLRIDNELQPEALKTPDFTRATFDKATGTANMEAELAELGFWTANYQRAQKPEYKIFISQKMDDFRKLAAEFEGYDLSAEERRAIQGIREIFDDVAASIQRVVTIEDAMTDQRERFISLRIEMDELFDDQMQPIALRHLAAPRQNAEAAADSVLNTIGVLIPLYVFCAIVAGALLIGFIMRPLNRLMMGTRVIGRGDLTHRIAAPGSDEFSDLSHHFNRMVGQLQETTVSKDLLQKSEERLSETVTELRHEILEREHGERERARLQTALQRSEAMSAMGVLVSGVAHEVRNPLFGISSTLDAMEVRLQGDAHHRYLGVLREEIGRLSRLMGDLLEYGRPAEPVLVPVSLRDVIEDAIAACAARTDATGIEIERRMQAEDDCVMMDRPRLCQVFQNLIENAIHHAPPTSVITIETVAADAASDATTGAKTQTVVGDSAGKWLECSVSDQGPGFAADDLPHIFEPFFSRRRGGTGLGLGIALRIVEQHGATIGIENRADGGAIARVRLPVCVHDTVEA